MRPPLRSALAHHVGADRDAIALALHRGEHLAVLGEHQVDDAAGGELVDAEGGGVDGFGGERLPLRTNTACGTSRARRVRRATRD